MKYSVCITYLKDVDDCCRNWNLIINGFSFDKIYVMGSAPWEATVLRDAEHIISLDDLPKDKKVVVMAPKNGKAPQGEISLYDYQHEDDTIYVFGPDIGNLTQDMLGDRDITTVYIPVNRVFYSWVAAAMTFYDLGLNNDDTDS